MGILSSLRDLASASRIPDSNPKCLGEWTLLTSPTSFNQFVMLRWCSSIDLSKNEFLKKIEFLNLMKEDRHQIKLNGRIIQSVKCVDDESDDADMVFRRVCFAADDGLLSLDWPTKLKLEEERNFDSTILIIPGTVEGSRERKIRSFVSDCLRANVFPVIMNPRGCAGSPVTSPRVFTAADSNDISIAIQYITNKRSWTTLMAVGWEHGANMLTKYLAECVDGTPIVAATCVNNPFDLEDATKSPIYQDFYRRQAEGLRRILKDNKELFEDKRFDVEGALSASSIRDFDKAISMVSYGFDNIEDFYAKSSTRDMVDKVKVPVLFIQNDDRRAIPQSLIMENPYTSLLLCSYNPSSKFGDDKLMLSWCHHLILEWLVAVELGLLKGRHPLLKDVDVVVQPSKILELLEGRASSKRVKSGQLFNLNNESSTNPPLKMFQENGTDMETQFGSSKDVGELQIKGLQGNNVGKQSNAADDTTIEENNDSSDIERGQVLETAQVVMNMLDVTMPEALSDAQKKQVLTAVGQGETIIKALQDVVPEDDRGKLTTAVSSILQSPGSDLKFDKDKLANANYEQDVQSGDQKKGVGIPEGGYSSVDEHTEMSARDMESDTVGTLVAIHDRNIVETDAAIMGELDVSDKAGVMSNQKTVDRVPEEGRSHPAEDVQSLDQKKGAGGLEVGYSSVNNRPNMSTMDIEPETVVTNVVIHGGNTAETDVAIQGGNTAETDVVETASDLKFDKDIDKLANANCEQGVQSLDQEEAGGPEDGYSSANDSPEMSAGDMESDTAETDVAILGSNTAETGVAIQGGNTAKTVLAIHGGNTIQTNVAIMEVPSKGQDSSSTLDVSNRAGGISNQRKVERVPEVGQSNIEEENDSQKNDFSSDQNKKSEPCITEEISSVRENEAENNQDQEEKGSMSMLSRNTSDSTQVSSSRLDVSDRAEDISNQNGVKKVPEKRRFKKKSHPCNMC